MTIPVRRIPEEGEEDEFADSVDEEYADSAGSSFEEIGNTMTFTETKEPADDDTGANPPTEEAPAGEARGAETGG